METCAKEKRKGGDGWRRVRRKREHVFRGGDAKRVFKGKRRTRARWKETGGKTCEGKRKRAGKRAREKKRGKETGERERENVRHGGKTCETCAEKARDVSSGKGDVRADEKGEAGTGARTFRRRGGKKGHVLGAEETCAGEKRKRAETCAQNGRRARTCESKAGKRGKKGKGTHVSARKRKKKLLVKPKKKLLVKVLAEVTSERLLVTFTSKKSRKVASKSASNFASKTGKREVASNSTSKIGGLLRI